MRYGPFSDSLSFSTQGLGDPYGVTTLHVEKNEFFRYDLTRRRSDYFNPAQLNGGGGNLLATHRTMQDHDLTFMPRKWTRMKLGYSRNHEAGPDFSAYELYIGGLARSVLPLSADARRDSTAQRDHSALARGGHQQSFARAALYRQ